MYWYGRLRPLPGELRKGQNDSPIRTRHWGLKLAAQWPGVSAIENYQSFGQRGASAPRGPPPPPIVSAPALVDCGAYFSRCTGWRVKWHLHLCHAHWGLGYSIYVCVVYEALKRFEHIYTLICKNFYEMLSTAFFCSFQGQVILFVAPVW